MKKIFKFIFSFCIFYISVSIASFGAFSVVEVGANVKVNSLAKIEQAKNTLEAIKQTKNQIIQLKNDALNLNKWAGNILNETLGISAQDINNLLEIKRLSTDLYNDAKNFDFDKEFKLKYDLDLSKLTPHQLETTHRQTKQDLENINKDLLKYQNEMQKKVRSLKKNVENFNKRNGQVKGNLEAVQLSNEILNSIYSSVNTLTASLKEQELLKQKKEMNLEREKEEKNEYRKRRYIKETERVAENEEYDVIYF